MSASVVLFAWLSSVVGVNPQSMHDRPHGNDDGFVLVPHVYTATEESRKIEPAEYKEYLQKFKFSVRIEDLKNVVWTYFGNGAFGATYKANLNLNAVKTRDNPEGSVILKWSPCNDAEAFFMLKSSESFLSYHPDIKLGPKLYMYARGYSVTPLGDAKKSGKGKSDLEVATSADHISVTRKDFTSQCPAGLKALERSLICYAEGQSIVFKPKSADIDLCIALMEDLGSVSMTSLFRAFKSSTGALRPSALTVLSTFADKAFVEVDLYGKVFMNHADLHGGNAIYSRNCVSSETDFSKLNVDVQENKYKSRKCFALPVDFGESFSIISPPAEHHRRVSGALLLDALREIASFFSPFMSDANLVVFDRDFQNLMSLAGISFGDLPLITNVMFYVLENIDSSTLPNYVSMVLGSTLLRASDMIFFMDHIFGGLVESKGQGVRHDYIPKTISNHEPRVVKAWLYNICAVAFSITNTASRDYQQATLACFGIIEIARFHEDYEKSDKDVDGAGVPDDAYSIVAVANEFLAQTDKIGEACASVDKYYAERHKYGLLDTNPELWPGYPKVPKADGFARHIIILAKNGCDYSRRKVNCITYFHELAVPHILYVMAVLFLFAVSRCVV